KMKERLGNFNFASCHRLFEAFVKSKQVSEQIISTHNQKFIAFSGVFYTYNFLGIDRSPLKNNVESQVKLQCQTVTWDQFKMAHSDTDEKYAAVYCANAAYLHELLYHTYQLQ